MTIDTETARASLLARRHDLVASSEATADERRPVTLDQQSVGRLSRVDALQMQAMAQEAERRRAVDIARIDAALARIEAGDYGWCLRCGEPVGEKRLALDPATALCIACARDASR